jgi:hypothetical protein
VNLHIVPRVGKLKLAKLTKKDVESFRDGPLSGVRDQHKALSRPLARKVLTSFKSLLKVAGAGHVAAAVTLGTKKCDERKLEIGRDSDANLVDSSHAIGQNSVWSMRGQSWRHAPLIA